MRDAGEAAEPAVAEATVRYFNRDVITLRSVVLGRTPAVRATAAAENIDLIVAQAGAATVSFNEAPQGLLVLVANQLVFIVTPADLDTLRNQTMADARAQIACAEEQRSGVELNEKPQPEEREPEVDGATAEEGALAQAAERTFGKQPRPVAHCARRAERSAEHVAEGVQVGSDARRQVALQRLEKQGEE